jgi:serine/threonine protein kinase
MIDFGLARRVTGADRDEHVSGTPHYLAPERAGGAAATVATDIYALGVLGYLMVAGTLPFDGNIVEVLMKQLQEAPARLSARRGEPVDDALEALITRAMAKDPAQRHPSAAAFRYELNNVMDMLDMGRRKRTSPAMRAVPARDTQLAAMFDKSRLPQLLVSADATIQLANPAFYTLLAHDGRLDGVPLAETALASHVPGLARAVRLAHMSGKPSERRATVYRGTGQAPLLVVIWLAP